MFVVAGYAILLARIGAGAIKTTKEHALDLVLLEIDLSDIEGVDVVRAIRENPVRAGTPIIAISAFPYMGVICLDKGCNGFIQTTKALDILTQLRKLTKGQAVWSSRRPDAGLSWISFHCP
jgi:two-component system, sensor histidine kinase